MLLRQSDGTDFGAPSPAEFARRHKLRMMSKARARRDAHRHMVRMLAPPKPPSLERHVTSGGHAYYRIWVWGAPVSLPYLEFLAHD
jgi:hypothetical protein